MTSSGHCVFSPLNVREPPAGCRMRENVTRVQPRSIVTIKVQSVADTEGIPSLPLVEKTRVGHTRRVIPETVIELSIIYHFRKSLGPLFSTMDSSHATGSPHQTV